MTINLSLLIVFLAFVGVLTAIETYTAIKRIPTISERIRDLARRAPLVTVITCLIISILLDHFFAQW